MAIDFSFASVRRRFEKKNTLSHAQRSLCSSGVRSVHCAGSELVVLVFEQDPTNLRLPICDCRFAIADFEQTQTAATVAAATRTGKLIVRRLLNQRPALKPGFNGRKHHFYSSSVLRF
jgi:hypothetical protein